MGEEYWNKYKKWLDEEYGGSLSGSTCNINIFGKTITEEERKEIIHIITEDLQKHGIKRER